MSTVRTLCQTKPNQTKSKINPHFAKIIKFGRYRARKSHLTEKQALLTLMTNLRTHGMK